MTFNTAATWPTKTCASTCPLSSMAARSVCPSSFLPSQIIITILPSRAFFHCMCRRLIRAEARPFSISRRKRSSIVRRPTPRIEAISAVVHDTRAMPSITFASIGIFGLPIFTLDTRQGYWLVLVAGLGLSLCLFCVIRSWHI